MFHVSDGESQKGNYFDSVFFPTVHLACISSQAYGVYRLHILCRCAIIIRGAYRVSGPSSRCINDHASNPCMCVALCGSRGKLLCRPKDISMNYGLYPERYTAHFGDPLPALCW